MDLWKLPVAKFLNAVYAWAVDGADPEKREEWDAALTAPLPGRERQATPAQIEDEGEAFMAMMQVNQALKAGGV